MIVAEGRDKNLLKLQIVEVLNTETLQWSTTSDLPLPLSSDSAAICGDHVYILEDSNM